MAARYPLAAALTQREHMQEAAKLRLMEARAAMAQAEAELSAATSAWSALASSRAALLNQANKPSRTRASSRTGGELARDGAYAARLGLELAELAIRVQHARRALADHARSLRLAELHLTDAYAQRELVERHHARFQQAASRARERARELETEELQQRTGRR